jgi:hypothetical protein
MALYFNSTNFGTLALPRIDYKWWIDGWTGYDHLLRTDIPIGAGSLIPVGQLLINKPVGTFISILDGATDTYTGNITNIGVLRDVGIPGDDDMPSFTIARQDQSTMTVAGVTQRMALKVSGSLIQMVVGYTQYNNDASQPCMFSFICPPFYTKEFTIRADFGVAAIWTGRDAGEITNAPLQCTYTDDQLGLIDGLDFAQVKQFECSSFSTYGSNTLNFNILTANGGGSVTAPDDFQGEASISLYLGGDGVQLGFYTDSYGGEDANNWYDEILYCGLIDVYNPSASDLRGIAQQLRNTSFLAQIEKLWDNPIESIVSLFMIPVGVPGSMLASRNIYLGGQDTGISSYKVVPTNGSFGKHSVTISMGSININEENKGFFDYSPYNQMSIYLPFIGFRSISASMVMNCKVTLTYEVDLLTGDCSAVLKSLDNKWGHTRCIEVGRGNTATQIPLTSTNYMGMYSGLLNAGAALASGNILGAANSAMSMQTTFDHSGSLGGNTGVISPRRAFLLSERPPTYNYVNFNAVKGRPNNSGVKVGSLQGFTQGGILIDASNIPESAKNAIKAAFERGVYV